MFLLCRINNQQFFWLTNWETLSLVESDFSAKQNQRKLIGDFKTQTYRFRSYFYCATHSVKSQTRPYKCKFYWLTLVLRRDCSRVKTVCSTKFPPKVPNRENFQILFILTNFLSEDMRNVLTADSGASSNIKRVLPFYCFLNLATSILHVMVF